MESTLWSLGSVDLDEIGASILYIPYKRSAGYGIGGGGGFKVNKLTTNPERNKDDNRERRGVSGEDEADGQSDSHTGIVLHVSVRLAEPHDNASVIVIIWKETIASKPSMSVQNLSNVPITLRQADIEIFHDIRGKDHLFEVTVAPGQSLPLGWADPDCGTLVKVRGRGYRE